MTSGQAAQGALAPIMKLMADIVEEMSTARWSDHSETRAILRGLLKAALEIVGE